MSGLSLGLSLAFRPGANPATTAVADENAIELEDGSGALELEDGSGAILLED